MRFYDDDDEIDCIRYTLDVYDLSPGQNGTNGLASYQGLWSFPNDVAYKVCDTDGDACNSEPYGECSLVSGESYIIYEPVPSYTSSHNYVPRSIPVQPILSSATLPTVKFIASDGSTNQGGSIDPQSMDNGIRNDIQSRDYWEDKFYFDDINAPVIIPNGTNNFFIGWKNNIPNSKI